MADYTPTQGENVPVTVKTRYKDMGDGTHAIVGALALGGVALPTAIVHGQTAVANAGTQVPLGPSTTLYSGVRVKALAGNGGWIYVGGTTVSSANGFVLDAGEEVFLEVSNLATVWVDSSVNTEGVSYIGT